MTHEDEEMITELHFQVMQSFKTEKYIFSVLDEACGVSVWMILEHVSLSLVVSTLEDRHFAYRYLAKLSVLWSVNWLTRII